MLLEQLLDTPEYQFDKPYLLEHLFLSTSCLWLVKLDLKKTPEVRDVFDSAWGTLLAASNSDRVEIVYYTNLEVSIKELTRIGRAKEEPIKIINLNLDSPVPPEIKKYWALSVIKERLQILSRNYILIKGKKKGKETAWNMREYGFSLTRILPYKDRIYSALIRENTG